MNKKAIKSKKNRAFIRILYFFLMRMQPFFGLRMPESRNESLRAGSLNNCRTAF